MVSPITGQFPRKEMALEPVKASAGHGGDDSHVRSTAIGVDDRVDGGRAERGGASNVDDRLRVSGGSEKRRTGGRQENLTFIELMTVVFFVRRLEHPLWLGSHGWAAAGETDDARG
jgi:hypothetical protein